MRVSFGFRGDRVVYFVNFFYLGFFKKRGVLEV